MGAIFNLDFPNNENSTLEIGAIYRIIYFVNNTSPCFLYVLK